MNVRTFTQIFAFVFITSFSLAQSPGGISSDLRIWLKADDGFSPSSWTDHSGANNHYTQTNMSRQPFVASELYNFNPVVDFGGSASADGRFMVVPDGQPFSDDGLSGTFVTVTLNRTGGTSGYRDILGFGSTTTGDGLIQANVPAITKLNDAIVLYSSIVSPFPGEYPDNELLLTDVSYTVNVAGIEYGLNGRTDTTAQIRTTSDSHMASGSVLGSQGEVTNGVIGELIAFERDLTANEKQRVRSYLAIKYGVTLRDSIGIGFDYVDALGIEVWSGTSSDSAYHHNVFGIARDDASALHQKQSRSTNAGQKLIIGVDNALFESNASNTNELSEGHYFMVGDNGLEQKLDVPLTYTGGANGVVNFRFEAVWKAHNTNGAGLVTVAWPTGIDNLYLVQSSDETFDSGDIFTPMSTVVTINGVAYNTATVTAANGYFTLAGFQYAPGGVKAAAWYRADAPSDIFSDAGVTAAADNTTVQQWNEFLGTGYDLFQAIPANRPTFSDSTTLVNFNPTMSFNGANEMIYDPPAGVNIIDRENGSLYAAGYFNVVGNAALLGFDVSADYPGLHTYGADNLLFYTGGPGYQGVTNNSFSDNSYFIAGANWQNGAGSGVNYASSTVSLDGQRVFYNDDELQNAIINDASRDIILGGDFNWGDVDGQVNEGIIFEAALDSNEMDRVESYLAIKFGTTYALGQKNYLSSTSDSIWDASDNVDFNHNIFGIARDDISVLHQKQSRSTNTGQQLIIGNGGSLFDRNLINTNALTADLQFLMVGDNGLHQGLGTPLMYAGSGNGETNFRFDAIWKAQNTGGVGDVTVAWPAGIENLYLVQSADSTFDSSDNFTPMSAVDSINGIAYNMATVTIGDGSYFTLAGFACAPGGVIAGLMMWHRADDGTTTPGPKSIWKDASGNGRDVTQLNNTAYEPTLVTSADSLANSKDYFFNFNPFYYFDGADDFFYNSTETYFGSDTSAGSAYGVMFNSNLGGWNTAYGWADDDPNLARVGDEYQFWRGNVLPLSTSGALLQNKPAHIGSMLWRSGSYNGLYLNVNGQIFPDTLSSIGTVSQDNFVIGSEGFDLAGNGNEHFQGGIAEVFAYSIDHHNSTGDEKLRINSYLAIKYGITLLTENGASTSNYLSSQSVVVWDTLVNNGYNNNVAGLAHDALSCLSQNQSISENPGQQVLIGTLGLDSTNVVNPDSLVDGQFLLWGDNGGARRPCVYIEEAAAGSANVLFEAVWKVQNTNGVGTVRVAWPVQGTELSLVQSTDPAFDASDTYTPLTDTITISEIDYVYADVSLNDGSYFTFGTTIEHAPGGVFGNLSYWYRSDRGITSGGVGTDITEWTDFAYGVPVHQLGDDDLPQLQIGSEDYLNFNMGVNFTDVTQALGNLDVETLGSREFDIFTFTQKGVSGLRILNIGLDNTTFNGTNWDSPGITASGEVLRRDSIFSIELGYTSIGDNFAGNLNNLKYFQFSNDSVNAALNGTDLLPVAISHDPMGRAYGGHIFGASYGFPDGDDAGIVGSIGETIIYGCGQINDEERRRVESYLAVKYGMTLDLVDTLPYLSSAGDTTWLGSLSTSFNNNIFGIGRDDITALDQRVSKSANEELTDIILTIATTNDFMAENQNADRDSLAEDESFFLVGDDDNLSTGPLVNLELPVLGQRIPRRWFSQRTGNTGDIYFRSDMAAYGFASTDTISLIIADDSLFTENVTVVEGTFDGTYWEYAHNFDGGAADRYFTFGIVEGLLLPFGCNSDIYVSQDAPTQLYTADYTVNPLVYNPVGVPVSTGDEYNAIGLNPVDGYLYGVTGTNHLHAIGQNGEYVDLGIINGLGIGDVVSGEIDTAGNYYLTVSGQPILFSVELNAGVPYNATVIATDPVIANSGDLAYNLTDGLLYGITNGDGQVYSVDPVSGTVTLIGTPNYPAADGPDFGGLVGGAGQIYAFASEGGVYEIDETTGQLNLAANSPESAFHDAAHCVTEPLDIYAAMCLPTTTNLSQPNCSAFSPSISENGQAVFGAPDLLSNYASTAYPITVTFLNRWGGVIGEYELVDFCDTDTMIVCANLGTEIEFSVANSLGSCAKGFMRLNGTPGVVLTSAMAPDTTNPAVTHGRINVYCGDIPAPADYVPTAVSPCGGRATAPQVQPDWIMPFPCDVENDTAEVIFRTWESYDKEGRLTTLTDTIVVFRLPRLTPGAFVGTFEDSFYCELETVVNDGDAEKRYASWKQPLGLHDYERPYDKLRGVTYEIPATIIIAGLTHAFSQGAEVYAEYLECVILRKTDGTEVTIGDIVTGAYAAELVASASPEQTGYGILQILIELNEKPINIVLEALLQFYPYLLLEEGDWVLSEGGNFEQVTSEWFFNGNGNAPYWFAGGWPSIYGSGDCVSLCDVGAGDEFGCIQIAVPLLDTAAGFGEECDTICLPTGVHCGITIKTDELADWTQTGTAGSCPQTRGVDSWITQTCWAATANNCASDGGDIACGEPYVAEEGSIVVDYSCTDKSTKVHISQWQTLFDTIGPIFDYCYSVTPVLGFPTLDYIPSNIEVIAAELGFILNDFLGEATVWDLDTILSYVREGQQFPLAALDEMLNPTVYRVGSHDCASEVFVPDVTVVDNCSGVHSIKAMVEVQGGTRSVALEQTGVDSVLMANGEYCYKYTYSHLTNPIRIPPDSYRGGCDGSVVPVRYEAADNCWNQSEWYKFITIIDDTPPTVITDRNLNVSLEDKYAWVTAEAMDEGSWDNCAIDLKVARRTDWNADPDCVDLCSDLGPNAPYANWIDLLDDLGIDRNHATTAVGGGVVGETAVNGAYNVNDLSVFLNEGEIEEYYFNQIVWLWEDGQLCGRKVVHGWIYAIAEYIAENCSETDEHGNGLDVKELELIFDNLFGTPGYGNEVALIGGGWAKSVPVKCEDACEAVTGELLVMDYCCNWGTQWTDIHVEDNSNARLVKRLPDLAVSCEAYNIFYKDVVDAAAALGEGGSAADSLGLFAALDSAFGSYIKTWVNNQNQPTDIDGNLLPEDSLNFDYWNVTCEEVSEEDKIAVENHDGTIDWVTEVTKTTYLDTAATSAPHGIIGINCAATCVQDVWVDLDECGQGTITRRFFISSGCGQHAPSFEVEQVIEIKSACGMRASMFDQPANVGSKNAPICLPQGLSNSFLPDTIGALTVKEHLLGKLCNSFAIGSEIKELDVVDAEGMKKYIIEWTAIDWCAPHTSTNREFTYTQEVIATIDPSCDVTTTNPVDTTGTDTTDVSLVAGSIQTEDGVAVQQVEMKAVLGSGSPLITVTSGEGTYNFSISNGSQVSLVPGKNTGFSNGVSTQDLIEIQRHVLQKKALDSKYKKIAADANGNGSIDGLDVLELRKLVMQPDTRLPNNTSWKFFDTQTDKESYDVSNVNGDVTVDWIGVKIGDVNLSGDPARSSSDNYRSTTGELHLNVADVTLKGGELYRVDVTSDNFVNINGLQYTLSYLSNMVEVESIEAGALNVTKDNYTHYAPGVITSSWNEADGQNLSANTVLFTIVLKAKSEVQLRDVLSLNNRVTVSEAYDAEGGLKDVSLRFDGQESGFALYQNTPNPYIGHTVIGFSLPEATAAVISIYDVSGKLIKRIDGEYNAGYNEVSVASKDLSISGVLYYQLDTDKYTATRKMVVIE